MCFSETTCVPDPFRVGVFVVDGEAEEGIWMHRVEHAACFEERTSRELYEGGNTLARCAMW